MEKVLARFVRGNGVLLDLEFLTDSSGRRVAVRYPHVKNHLVSNNGLLHDSL
jgi:hypothetical protein